MNNFGILNLLTRFFDFYLKSKGGFNRSGGFSGGNCDYNDCGNNQFNDCNSAQEAPHDSCNNNFYGHDGQQNDPLSNLFKIINEGKECPDDKRNSSNLGNCTEHSKSSCNNNGCGYSDERSNDDCSNGGGCINNGFNCDRGGGGGTFGEGGLFGNGGLFGKGGLFGDGGLLNSLSSGLQGLLSGLGKLFGIGGGSNNTNNSPNNFANNDECCKHSHQQNCFRDCPPRQNQHDSAFAKTNSSHKQNGTYSPQVQNPPPLQKAMLATMSAHDQFIKRVKQNNKK